MPPEELASPLSSRFLQSISHSPGVYQMLGKREVLYVGKAKDLRKRLAQYAHFRGSRHSKTAVMLSHVRRVETILTHTEKEALILEASLIKKHRPRYNVILRDDKNYPLIKVTTADSWPRIVVTRKRLRDRNRYFGPYASTTAMRATLKLLHTMFPLHRCRTVRPRPRPCLNHQMGRCLAPCCGLVTPQQYQDIVRQAILLLEGKNKTIRSILEEKMRDAANTLAFEQAARYRDQLRGLERTLEQQVIVSGHGLDQDVFGLVREDAAVGMAILFVRGGMVSGAQSFFLADPLGDDGQILTQTLVQYYSRQRHPPRELLLPLDIQDKELVQEHLQELRQGRVTLRIPQRGVRKKLMDMALSNASQIFAEQRQRQRSWLVLADTLQKRLHLRRSPEVIECVDIANISGKQPVGSLVCFIAGHKKTRRYRHYRIQGGDEPDDYRMMREVLQRRFSRGLERDDLPDMLLVDGGRGQLGVAQAVAADLGVAAQVDLVAIAKDRQGEGEKLYRPGRKNPLLLPAHTPALLFLMRIRDEAHRFGNTFHRQLRRRATLLSRLEELPGIGPQRRQQLLTHLGSLQRVLKATEQELAAVPGIGPKLAQQIHRHLHRQAS